MENALSLKEKLELKRLKKLITRCKYQELVLFMMHTHDLQIMHEIVQFLYREKQWDFLDQIYLTLSPNQVDRRNCLIDIYEARGEKIKEKMANSCTEQEKKLYTEELDLIISHILSTAENTPGYASALVDIFIQNSSSSALLKRASLILSNYPEKRLSIREELLKHNNLLHLYYFLEDCVLADNTLDLDLASYIFHQVEFMYGKMAEEKNYQPSISSQDVIMIYENLKKKILKYNQEKLEQFKKDLSENPLKDFINEVLTPRNPVLSMLDVMPISEIDKNKIIGNTFCDEYFQNELLMTFLDRKNYPEKMKLLDVYYVLYQDPIQKSLHHKMKYQYDKDIHEKNQKYLKYISLGKKTGTITDEDIIGAIGEGERPIFGLFSLISNLPMDELVAIASNISFENSLMSEQLFMYLKQCKEGNAVYNEKIQSLDVHYVKSKTCKK